MNSTTDNLTYRNGPLRPEALRLMRIYIRNTSEAITTGKKGYDRVAGLDSTLTTEEFVGLRGLLDLLDRGDPELRKAAYAQALTGWPAMHTPPSYN